MGEVTLAFESKVPHATPWLNVEYPVGDEPTELLDALKALGWEEDQRMLRMPPLNGVQEVKLMGPKGSDLFGEWTEAERRERMPVVRRALRKQGFDRVPWNRLTLADML